MAVLSVAQYPSESSVFETARLGVAPWHVAASRRDLDLVEVVAEMLTARTTAALPETWKGEFTLSRAAAWIEERDQESPTLLVTDTRSDRPVGLVILADIPLDAQSVDVRIGYLFREDAWGQGLATELVAGLAAWARTQPSVNTLTGGVDIANPASARVLIKNGFEPVLDSDQGETTYQLKVEHDEWDQYAPGWDQDLAARAYAAAAFSSLQEIAREGGVRLAGAQVIDFGCGTGLLTERLVSAGASVYAVDTSPAMLAVVDDKVAQHGWTRVETSMKLPATAPSYDLIVCSSVCAFLDDYPATAAELVAHLRPGGIFVQWDWERTVGDPDGLDRTEIRAALDGANLVGISVETGFAISVGELTMSPLVGVGRRPQDPTTAS